AGGDEVVVIYNTRMPGSEDVAKYYAKVRHVPKNQIYGFSLTSNEDISRDEFRDSLQLPLARRLEYDGLWKFGPVKIPATNGQPEHIQERVVASKIRYAVLCYGVPLKIAADSDLHENVKESVRPELRRNEAAVDSELSWLPLVQMDMPLSGPLPNSFYGATNAAFLNPTNGILLVARLDGPSADIAKGLVDKAMQAEREGLWGRAYFDARGLEETNSYFLGDEWILDAAEISRQLGFETTVDDKPETFPASFPMSQIALYCGWYDGDVSGPFTLPKVEFMPGAFAYHLHSFSAETIRSATRNWVGPLLAKGATCTMGCVYEPYLSGTPNVTIFVARWIGRGFTFGEAAWAAQPVLSWQTTVVGDPLYRPFGESPQLLHAELSRAHSPLVEWSDLRVIDLARVHGATPAQVMNYLENISATTNSAVLTEKLAELCDTEGKPSSAIENYQRALKLNPSPEQRIQIRLTLAEKLLAQGRDADAIENYKNLLVESPDYPGKDSIAEKLAALENKTAVTNSLAKP
ncbi:MAG TPA: TIGR03790 family protein, partial [Candidatus Dormibacteraeota bacterium]|nr:TIGR03790 family protein [Candidatus Dormibacteraeota bacterium]